MSAVVRGRDNDGKTVFYTGKAGKGFVSTKFVDAFGYGSLEEARRRAANLNRMSAIHGFLFHGVDYHNAKEQANEYVVLLDDEPLGDLTCKVCFGIHAAHQCPHDE